MKDLYHKALSAYIEMLTLHIDTKTTDIVFHRESEKFYETLFDVAHEIGEKFVDQGGDITEKALQAKKQKAYDLIVSIKKELESYKANNQVTLGTEDLLGSLANDLENIEGTSKSFLQ